MKTFYQGLLLALQIALLFLVNLIGVYIEQKTHIPVPGNVIGMMLLFLLLEKGILPVAFVKKGADFLLKHLTFLFIPVVVGFMPWGKLFLNQGIPIMTAILVSVFVALAVTGMIVEHFAKTNRKKENDAYN
ncbi:MAG: putative effector of murein hydrolase LrgA [Peptococcaceae bacterium]|jgi:holin-like protein|nr:putative effector of murein hydrolase LrgA [Peptococcaceae bacterium]